MRYYVLKSEPKGNLEISKAQQRAFHAIQTMGVESVKISGFCSNEEHHFLFEIKSGGHDIRPELKEAGFKIFVS